MSQLFCFSLARKFDQSGQEFPLKIPIKFSSPEKLNPILHGGGGGGMDSTTFDFSFK